MDHNDQNNHFDKPDDFNSDINEPDYSRPERHGCVTVWLILMLILNSLVALIYIFAAHKFLQTISSISLVALIIIGLLNAVFSFMLLSWKKIAFYGFAITSVIAFAINISIGVSPIRSILGLVGIGVLYGILQITKDGVSAWEYLS